MEYSTEKGYVSFIDLSLKPRLVYFAPIIHLPSNKTTIATIDWDSATSSILIDLPDLTLPIVLAFGVGVKIPEARGSFGFSFPSFKFGEKGDVESEEEDDEEEEEIHAKGRAGFGLPSFKFGKGKDIGLPSFTAKFPSFKFNSAWFKSLYGSSGSPLVAVPSGDITLPNPSLGLNFSLSLDGLLTFGGPDWSLKLAPISVSVRDPQLFTRDGLLLVRGEDGEFGVSFDKQSSRHWFFIGKPLSSPKFGLKFELGASSVDFNKVVGYLAILDASKKVKLVYSLPFVKLSSNKSVNLPLDWESSSSTLYITLPDLGIPVAIAFGLSTSIPDVSKGFGFSFPSFKFSSKGEVEDSSSDDETTKEKKDKSRFKVNIFALMLLK